MPHKIIEITAYEALPIRHRVMWPDKPFDYVKLPEDNEGRHYGLFLANELISVISLFITNGEAQFRKFATVESYQGKGYGSLLLHEIMKIAALESLTRIWCNARKNKSDYYSKFGMTLTNETYTKGGIDFVVMERILS